MIVFLFIFSIKLIFQVKGGSKVTRLLDHASSLFKTGESKTVIWTGSGDGVLRAISCAEAMKRHLRIRHQITKIGYRKYANVSRLKYKMVFRHIE